MIYKLIHTLKYISNMLLIDLNVIDFRILQLRNTINK
jgi:hypothetical protein